jgi:hypothetical protein
MFVPDKSNTLFLVRHPSKDGVHEHNPNLVAQAIAVSGQERKELTLKTKQVARRYQKTCEGRWADKIVAAHVNLASRFKASHDWFGDGHSVLAG